MSANETQSLGLGVDCSRPVSVQYSSNYSIEQSLKQYEDYCVAHPSLKGHQQDIEVYAIFGEVQQPFWRMQVDKNLSSAWFVNTGHLFFLVSHISAFIADQLQGLRASFHTLITRWVLPHCCRWSQRCFCQSISR